MRESGRNGLRGNGQNMKYLVENRSKNIIYEISSFLLIIISLFVITNWSELCERTLILAFTFFQISITNMIQNMRFSLYNYLNFDTLVLTRRYYVGTVMYNVMYMFIHSIVNVD